MAVSPRYLDFGVANRVEQGLLDFLQILCGMTERAGVQSSKRSLHSCANRVPDM
jgi:hypothetical protein